MGSNFSMAYNTTSTADGSSSKPSRIVTFHSSARWKAHFDACKASSKLLVIDFTASWCGPCKYIEPAVIEMANKYTDVEFAKIDVDELMDVAQEYRVQAMPTFILIKEGKEVDKVVGAKKDELEKKILKHLPTALTSTI
ncbi:thioredoxin H2 [Macadamia integrifolia]|uniref:thioredoxin H2 n=1 Tax=Macadamia integrifolia TaxID=60698 RepID=UPI001C4F4C78|nr:thioredoxin H2 [Macadamia integrifolia]